jgi:hypothetical protein
MTTISTRMRTRRKRKRTSGSSPLRAFFIVALALAMAFSGFAREKRKIAPASTALITGTVFRDSGLSLPGAAITLQAEAAPGAKSKAQKIRAVSDSRGEFAIRVPAAPMRYTFSVTADGFETSNKQVVIQGEERVDLSIQLSPRPK